MLCYNAHLIRFAVLPAGGSVHFALPDVQDQHDGGLLCLSAFGLCFPSIAASESASQRFK
jgi:hypothetical protein